MYPKLLIVLSLFLLSYIFNLIAQPQEWQFIGLENEPINSIAVNPFDNSIIYAGSGSNFSAGTYGKLFKSINYGQTWDTLLTGISVSQIAIHPKKPYIIYVALASTNLTVPGIIKSVNSGSNWFKADSGITLNFEISVGAVAPHPDSIDVVYAGTGGFFGGKVYKSINGGEFWKAYNPDVLCCNFEEIEFDPIDPSTIYVASNRLYRSTNDGKSWSLIKDWTDVASGIKIAIDYENNNILYAGLGNDRLLKSFDKGSSWSFADSGITHNNYHELFIDPNKNNKLYTVTSGGVSKTEDSGNLWFPINDGFSENIYFRTISISSSGKNLYCGTDSGLYIYPIITSIKTNNNNIKPKSFQLFQNYPNPFNATTKIPFLVPKSSNVEIRIYNSLGKQIYKTTNIKYPPGYFEFSLNLNNFASGLYYYELKTNTYIQYRKMLLIR